MKNRFLKLGIITSLCLEFSGAVLPHSVSDMMAKDNMPSQVVGWIDYNKDDDNDGVPDYRDKCLNTPNGAKVDKYGCVLDNDKDGVGDYLDKCPNTPIGVKVDENGCGVDEDKDGVVDYKDKCLDTPSGLKVDKYGCVLDTDGDDIPYNIDKCPKTPSGVKVDKNGCPLDDDKDGVPNYLDKCPNTPNGIEVDKNGCILDTDKDGVVDSKDKCPNTPKDTKVNKEGCPVLATYIFNFKFNSYKINKKYYKNISKLARILQNDKMINIEIQGYTDNVGDEDYNMDLSLNRANALKRILVSKFNISANRITIKGFGSKYPIASNDTPEGQALNRRVVVIQKASKPKVVKKKLNSKPKVITKPSQDTNSTNVSEKSK